MLSAKQLPQDIKQGFLSGTDDYMTKPVDEEDDSIADKHCYSKKYENNAGTKQYNICRKS